MRNSTAFILLVISAGIYFTFTSSQLDDVSTLRAEASNYQSVLQNISSLTEKRDELKVKYQNIPTDETTAMARVLPNNVSLVNLATNLDAMAGKYGISVNGITTTSNQQAPLDQAGNQSTAIGGGGAAPNPYQTASISFGFSATYDNFRKFLADIEHSLRIIDIRDLSIQVGNNGVNQYKITADTYWSQ